MQSDQARTRAAKAIACAGLLAGMALSWRLWIGARDFPRFPRLPFAALPPALEAVLAGAAAVLLVAMALRPWQPRLTLAFFAVFAVLWLQDQLRLQPWVYLYLVMLAPLGWLRAGQPEAERAAILNAVRLVVVGVYLWSGLHKFSDSFLGLYESMLRRYTRGLSEETLGSLNLVAYPAPYLETAMAVFLVFRRTRPIGVVMACVMHALILLLLGPLGANYNPVVWPWNVCMIAFVLVLFRGDFALRLVPLPGSSLRYALFAIPILMFPLPALSYAGLWDRSLSFHLYTGRSPRLSVFMEDTAVDKLSPAYRERVERHDTPRYPNVISVKKWCMEELSVTFLSEDRIVLQFCKQLCREPFDDQELAFHTDYTYLRGLGFDLYLPSEVRAFDALPPFRKRYVAGD